MIIHPERMNCIGCECLDEIDGVAECMDLTYWHGGTPRNPECYREPETAPETNGPQHCVGCSSFEIHNDKARCSKNIHWPGGTPKQPRCFERLDDSMAAVSQHLRLIERSGMDPDTMRAMLLSIQLVGYLADGTPMITLDDIAAKSGMSLQEAEVSYFTVLSYRDAIRTLSAVVRGDYLPGSECNLTGGDGGQL